MTSQTDRGGPKRPALRSGALLFGPDRVLFRSDTPYDPEKGLGYIRSGIADMELTGAERAAIVSGNVRRLTGSRLPA